MPEQTRVTCGRRPPTGRGGFSLIELVIVVVIIAIIGAIAIPKMSRGAAGANESALVGDLATMRSALELYAQEHGGTYPSTNNVMAQLISYTDVSGNISSTSPNVRATPYIYGPYLKAFPPLPAGTNRGQTAVTYNATGMSAAGTGSYGWLYDGTTFWANDPVGDTDTSGKAYQSY